jgi:hypothetical protein
VLVGVVFAIFPLILAAAPVGTGLARAAWVLAMLGLVAFVIARSARMGVSAGPTSLVVRNFGRDYQLPWEDVAGIDAGPSDNVTGLVTTIVIRRTDGTKLVGRGASSYSRPAVERWRDELDVVHQGRS